MAVNPIEMAVGFSAGVHHAHLRRSTTEGPPADRPGSFEPPAARLAAHESQ
jgi:hypothetical protein